MGYDNMTRWTSRPTLEQYQTYVATPKYNLHQSYEDKLAILVCQIKIWKAKDNKWFDIPSAAKCLTIRECESVEIHDSAKELMGKAVVKFPRGTVISKTAKMNKTVKTVADLQSKALSMILKDATNSGEILIPGAATYEDSGESVTSMAASYDDKGIIPFNRTKTATALLSPNDVAIGNRIEIRLGYAYSEGEFDKLNSQDNTGNSAELPVAFTGFITGISPSTPLELECTNMAHVLACVSTPNISAKATLSVKDFLDSDGKFHLLNNTGIELSEYSKKLDITVAGGSISDNLTVFDVLNQWTKSGVTCMMETQSDGTVKLRVGLSYYAGQGGSGLPNKDKKYITYDGGNNSVTILQFDWDVANDGLTLKRNDKKYIAVEAQGRTSANQLFKLTVRKNPDEDDDEWITESDGEFQVVNNRKLKPRKKAKIINGTLSTKKLASKVTDKVNMSQYTVIPYFSLKINVTEKELIEEAKQYWAKYNPNGISGKLTIFGDVVVRPTEVVGLIDPRQPEKDGYYYVESVDTTFGVNGYRRELTIPFKVASYPKKVEIIY